MCEKRKKRRQNEIEQEVLFKPIVEAITKASASVVEKGTMGRKESAKILEAQEP